MVKVYRTRTHHVRTMPNHIVPPLMTRAGIMASYTSNQAVPSEYISGSGLLRIDVRVHPPLMF